MGRNRVALKMVRVAGFNQAIAKQWLGLDNLNADNDEGIEMRIDHTILDGIVKEKTVDDILEELCAKLLEGAACPISDDNYMAMEALYGPGIGDGFYALIEGYCETVNAFKADYPEIQNPSQALRTRVHDFLIFEEIINGR